MRLFKLPICIAVTAALACGADWPMAGGGPEHNGWASSERQITKANAAEIKLLYRVRTDDGATSFSGPTTPMIAGNLITYVGFKEMLMFTSGADTVYSIDA